MVCHFQTILIMLYGTFNPAFVTGFHAGFRTVHCKKRFAIFLSPARMSLTKLSLAGNNLFIPGQESSVSDILDGGRKIENLFLQCNG
jgi:hypothetical protein